MLAPEDCKRARARIKSCSGIGAIWAAAIPTGPKAMLNDEIIRLCVHFRLGLETNALDFCPHLSAEGVACEHICDRFGDHLPQCPSGCGFFIGHDIVCAKVADLAGGK